MDIIKVFGSNVKKYRTDLGFFAGSGTGRGFALCPCTKVVHGREWLYSYLKVVTATLLVPMSITTEHITI